MKFGCCRCGAGTDAWPPPVKPPDVPLRLDGDAHGSLGEEVGTAVAVGSVGVVSDGVGVGAAAPGSAAAVGLMVPSGTGSDADGEAVLVGDVLAVGDALDSSPHSVLVTASGDGVPLADGVVLEDGIGSADGLSEGRSAGFGPLPPAAIAVAATDPNKATVAALSATDLRFIDLPPYRFPSPVSALTNGHSG